ncbi:MAG TPA: GAF domain-containing protein [Anaerolineaceae bacterium]|nr:GAF domain-containing protein [Anaerolineaceae bacterium]HPN53656.1 GAF domain-containing protein [Anaerolineaceae bacterium]
MAEGTTPTSQIPIRTKLETPKTKGSRGSLAQTILISLWVLSLFPVLLVGTALIWQYRNQIYSQVSDHLRTLVNNQISQISQDNEARGRSLETTATQGSFLSNIVTALAAPDNRATYALASAAVMESLNLPQRTQNKTLFDDFILVTPDYKIFMYSQQRWRNLTLNEDDKLRGLLQGRKTRAIDGISTLDLYKNTWVIVTTYPIMDENNNIMVTVVGISKINLDQIYSSTINLYPSAKVLIYDPANNLTEIKSAGPAEGRLAAASGQQAKLKSMLDTVDQAGFSEYTSAYNVDVLSYGKYIPSLDISLLTEIPLNIVYKPLLDAAPVTIGLLIATLLVIGILGWFGARTLTTPLISLAQTAQSFSEGKWSERSNIQRSDEIGVLATTFNRMAVDLTNVYQNLEGEVKERTRQLKTASEVAQLAASNIELDELLEKTCELVLERFNCQSVCIYLMDQTGSYAILRKSAGATTEMLKRKGYRVPANSQSLAGWVASHNEARIINNVTDYPFMIRDNLLFQVKSEAGLPLSLGFRVLGVLVLQSAQENAYSPDLMSVLDTLSNQLATAVENINLLHAAQDTLQGTSLLYQSSHQIITAANEADVLQITVNALKRTPYMTGLLVREGDYLHLVSLNDLPGKDTPPLPQERIPLQAAQKILPTPTAMVLSDIMTPPAELSGLIAIFRRLGGLAYALFPIYASGQLTGIVVISSTERDGLAAARIQPFSSLVEIISTAINQHRTTTEITQRLQNTQDTAQTTLGFLLETDILNLYRALFRYINTVIGQTEFYVLLYDPDNGRIEIPYHNAGVEIISDASLPVAAGLASRLMGSGRSILISENIENQVTLPGDDALGSAPKSWLGIPLLLEGKAFGALVLQDREHERRYTETDRLRLEAVANGLAVSIYNARRVNEINLTVNSLAEEKHLFDTLLNTMPEQVFFKDRGGAFLRANISCRTYLEVSSEAELVGKTDFDFYPPEQARQHFEDELNILSTQEPIQKIEKDLRPDHPDSWLLTTKAPLRDKNNEIIGILGISRDVSELMKSQEVAQRRAAQLQTTAEIAKDVSESRQLDELLVRVVNLVKERFGFYHASIFLLDPLGEFAVLRESTGEAGRQMKQNRHKLGVGSKSMVGQATSRGEPVVANNVTDDPSHRPNPLLPDTRAELAIPLKSGDKIIGAVDVQSTQINAFMPDDIAILQVLADQVAVAVSNTSLYDNAQRHLLQQRLLHEITTAASASQSVSDALKVIVDGLRTILPESHIGIFLLNPETEMLELKAWAGYERVANIEQTRVRLGQGIIGSTLSERKVVWVKDTRTDPRYVALDDNIRSEIAAPLFFGDEAIGVINVESYDLAAFGEEDRDMLGTLGGSMAAIVINARLLEQVRKQIERQYLLYEVTSRIRRATDINAILATSADEINKALGARRTSIEVTIGQTPLAEPAPVTTPRPERKNGKENA